MECKVIGFISQKGGVAKTTSAVNTAIGLAMKGFRVLLVDTDPQGSATSILGRVNPDAIDKTLASIFEMEINEATYNRARYAVNHNEEGIDYIPGNIELSGVEVSLVSVLGRETILKGYLNEMREYYDYIIVDCPPSLGLITINVLCAVDKVIIPTTASYLSLKGMEQLMKTVGKIKKGFNPKLGISGILVTMYYERTNHSKQVVELLENSYGGKTRVFETKIPHSIRVSEAAAEKKSIFSYEAKGKVAEAYADFVGEVLAYV